MANGFDSISRAFQVGMREFGIKPVEEDIRTAQSLDENRLRIATSNASTQYQMNLNEIRRKMDAGEFDDESGNLDLSIVEKERELARSTFQSSVTDFSSVDNLNYKDSNWGSQLKSFSDMLNNSVLDKSRISEAQFDQQFQERKIIANYENDILRFQRAVLAGNPRSVTDSLLDTAYSVFEMPSISGSENGNILTGLNVGDEIKDKEFVRRSILFNRDFEAKNKFNYIMSYSPEELNLSTEDYELYASSTKGQASSDFVSLSRAADQRINEISDFVPQEERTADIDRNLRELEAQLKANPWLLDSPQVRSTWNRTRYNAISNATVTEIGKQKTQDKTFESRKFVIENQMKEEGWDKEDPIYKTELYKRLAVDLDGNVRISPKFVSDINQELTGFLRKRERGEATRDDLIKQYHLLLNYGSWISEDLGNKSFAEDPFYSFARERFGPGSSEFGIGERDPAGQNPENVMNDLHGRLSNSEWNFRSSASSSGGSDPIITNNQNGFSAITAIFGGNNTEDIGSISKSHQHLENHPFGVGSSFLLELTLRDQTFADREDLKSADAITSYLESMGYTKQDIKNFDQFVKRGDTSHKLRSLTRALDLIDTTFLGIPTGENRDLFNRDPWAKQNGFYIDERGLLKIDHVIAAISGQGDNSTSQIMALKMHAAVDSGIIDVEALNKGGRAQEAILRNVSFENIGDGNAIVYHYGNPVSIYPIEGNPLADPAQTLSIHQDDYKLYRDDPILSQITFGHRGNMATRVALQTLWGMEDIFYHSRGELDALVGDVKRSSTAAMESDEWQEALSYKPRAVLAGDPRSYGRVWNLYNDVKDYILSTGLVDEEDPFLTSFFQESTSLEGILESTVGPPRLGPRRYQPSSYFVFGSPRHGEKKKFRIRSTDDGDAIIDIIDSEVKNPGILGRTGEAVATTVEGIERVINSDVIVDASNRAGMPKDKRVDTLVELVLNDTGVRRQLTNLGPVGAQLVADVDNLFSSKSRGQANRNNQARVASSIAALYFSQNPELFPDGPVTNRDIMKAMQEENEALWLESGGSSEDFPEHLDLRPLLDIQESPPESIRNIAGIFSRMYGWLDYFKVFSPRMLDDSIAVAKRVGLHPSNFLDPDNSIPIGPPASVIEAIEKRTSDRINRFTNGLGDWASEDEVYNKMMSQIIESNNVLRLPFTEKTVKETLFRASEVLAGVGDGVPVTSDMPLDVAISIPEIMGPFLDGKLEKPMSVNIQIANGPTTSGHITVVKDADTTKQTMEIINEAGETIEVEFTGRVSNLKAAEVWDAEMRRGGGAYPYAEVGGPEVTRFFAAVLNASGEETTIIVSGERGTFGRELIDVKLGPNQIDWAELAIKLGLGQIEPRFVKQLPNWGYNIDQSEEGVKRAREEFLREVEGWKNNKIYQTPIPYTRLFPTNHPFVEGSNVSLSLHENNGKHYVIPSIVDGNKVKDPFSLALENGLNLYPSFATRQEANEFIQSQDGNIDARGFWMPKRSERIKSRKLTEEAFNE